MTNVSENYFSQLSAVSVTEHLEKKGPFSYLSWPYAVSQLRQFDPFATWEVKRFDGLPYLSCELGVFVEVSVTVQGITLSQLHPVLDGRNRPILAPTSFDINTSIQRCLVKAIALHGLGLSIYAGEDLPLVESKEVSDIGTGELGASSSSSGKPGNDFPVRMDAITPAQVRYIDKLIIEVGAEKQKVLDYFGVLRVEDIAKSDANRVIRSLNQSRQRNDERRAA